jgi:hypothetical protein
MRSPIPQLFPRQVDGRIVRATWDLDLGAAHGLVKCKGFKEARLIRETAGMAEHFPRWLLSVSCGRELVGCKACKGMLVFDRGVRCVLCAREARARELPEHASLAWFGLMPPIGIDGLDKIKDQLATRPPPKHVVGTRDDLGTYLLVPLVASYNADFPANAPSIFYLPGMFSIPGMPSDSAAHEYHLFGQGQMCLFASGQWHKEMTMREVLEQRAYAHVIKLLNYANGKKNAFKIVS